MPPRARARSRSASGPSPLSDADVELLRERLGSGKKPRVTLLVDTALGSAGTSVPVVSFGEPAEGEFISVRLRDDVVPFSPAELAMPVRGRAAATPVHPTQGQPSQGQPSQGQPSQGPPSQAAQPSSPARLVAVPEPAPTPEPAAAERKAGDPKPAATADAAPAKAAASRRPGKPGALSVTVRFGGQGWTYESTRAGRRSAARPLNLAAIRAFADRLDDPSLRRDLQVAIDVCRDQARTRAETLRAELERVEVELAELDE